MENINKLSVRIAQYFFNATNRRATTATMKRTIGQAKSLLKSGFTPEEIIIAINELTKHPPKDGFNSLGFLSYVIEDILIKHKAKEVKKTLEATKRNITPKVLVTEQKPVVCVKQSVENRMGTEFNQNLF